MGVLAVQTPNLLHCKKHCTFHHHNPGSVAWLYCMWASGPNFGLVIILTPKVGHSPKWTSPLGKVTQLVVAPGACPAAAWARLPQGQPQVLAATQASLAHSTFDFCGEGNKVLMLATRGVFGNPRADTRPCPCCPRSMKELLYLHTLHQRDNGQHMLRKEEANIQTKK